MKARESKEKEMRVRRILRKNNGMFSISTINHFTKRTDENQYFIKTILKVFIERKRIDNLTIFIVHSSNQIHLRNQTVI